MQKSWTTLQQHQYLVWWHFAQVQFYKMLGNIFLSILYNLPQLLTLIVTFVSFLQQNPRDFIMFLSEKEWLA